MYLYIVYQIYTYITERYFICVHIIYIVL